MKKRVKQGAVVLALALGLPLAACQPAEQEAGGGGGAERPTAPMGAENPGDRFEEAYTNLAEVHISLVQGDWDAAADNMQEVRDQLEGMKETGGAPLPAVVTNQINELQRSALSLDQMITNRNPAAVAQSRTLMNTFTRESTLAQVGREGGGAGTAPTPNR